MSFVHYPRHNEARAVMESTVVALYGEGLAYKMISRRVGGFSKYTIRRVLEKFDVPCTRRPDRARGTARSVAK